MSHTATSSTELSPPPESLAPTKLPSLKVQKEYRVTLNKATQVEQLQTTETLAHLLGKSSARQLTWLSRNKSTHYSILYLKKKGSSTKLRKLHNPDREMRIVQFRLLTKLLDTIEIPPYIYGFERGKSIPKMAEVHVGKDVVISIDIKDFFPSIKQYMVDAMFKALGADPKVALVLSELCTYMSYVPQGSLTAPKISNLIAAGTFGPKIYKLCQEEGIDLTIYADDVTLSYTKPLPSLAEAKEYSAKIIGEVTAAITEAGFKINQRKTKIMRPHNSQWVCGAVVNQKVNMRKKERLALRAIVHNSTVNGVEAEARKAMLEPLAFIRKYAGRINWLCQLNPDAGVGMKVAFRKASQPFLKKNPGVEIPELAWNSSIEIQTTVQELQEAELGFKGDFPVASAIPAPISVTAPSNCPF